MDGDLTRLTMEIYKIKVKDHLLNGVKDVKEWIKGLKETDRNKLETVIKSKLHFEKNQDDPVEAIQHILNKKKNIFRQNLYFQKITEFN